MLYYLKEIIVGTKTFGLNSNILKIIALVSMTIDHIGVIFFSDVVWLRIVGRIAFPIFSFLIAEGCRYTKNKTKYFLTVFLIGIICEIVMRFFISGPTNILITLAFSIVICYLVMWVYNSIKNNDRKNIVYGTCCLVLMTAIVFILSEILPRYINGYEGLEYGFVGVMLPAIIVLIKNHYAKVITFACGLCLMCLISFEYLQIEWFCLLSIPIIIWYNGERGKYNLKYLFYIYYPVHIALLYGIFTIINK